MKIPRRKTREVQVGKVKIGGDAPVSIQSMAKTDTEDWEATARQIKRLKDAGCELVRVAVKNQDAAKALKKIKSNISIPLIADIHFDYRLALKAIEQGADKIRLNPGNMRRTDRILEVVAAAKSAKIPIRIGLNSGSIVPCVMRYAPCAVRSALKNFSLKRKAQSAKPKAQSPKRNAMADIMVKEAINYIKLFEKEGFYDIVISLKASDVTTTVTAYRRLAGLCDYPFHLGVTASGPYGEGIVKSSIGIGSLLLDGIGDTVRVSLTADPVREVMAAKRILQSLSLRRFYPQIISCPTCGRCQVDLLKIVNDFENKSTEYRVQSTERKFPTVAIMGCEVNGPGEAREADIGIAAGRGSGILFKKGKRLRKVAEKDFVKALLQELKRVD